MAALDIDSLPKAEKEELLKLIETMQTRDRRAKEASAVSLALILSTLPACACTTA